MADNPSVIPVGDFLAGAVADIVRKAPLTPEKIAFAWQQAVGAAVDRVTTIRLEGTTLRVHAQSAQWQREVERSAGLIRARLEALLGPGIVRSLDVTGPAGPHAGRIG